MSATANVVVMNTEELLALSEEPRGQIVGGEAGFRLRQDPDTTDGIDVACVSAQLAASTAPGAALSVARPRWRGRSCPRRTSWRQSWKR